MKNKEGRKRETREEREARLLAAWPRIKDHPANPLKSRPHPLRYAFAAKYAGRTAWDYVEYCVANKRLGTGLYDLLRLAVDVVDSVNTTPGE